MMSIRKKLTIAILLALCALYSGGAAAAVAPIAVIPLQDLSQGRNGVNIPFTRYLVERLEKSGTEIISLEKIIAFMSNNRLRSTGELETYHINLLREELGAAYVLLGTVIQQKGSPTLSLGLVLNLVRTSDGRTVWSYAGASSSAEFRKLLGIGEFKSVEALQTVLVGEIINRWPGKSLAQEVQALVSIDSILLQPERVAPGAEIFCSVHIRNLWPEARAPRVFFKADDQIHAASLSPDGTTYEATWIAGEKDGRFPVTLILEWPFYGRTETYELGSYVVDSVLPLLRLDLKGGSTLGGELPVFTNEVFMIPRRLIRKPITHWRVTIRNKDDVIIANQKTRGELPDILVWRGQNIFEGREVEGVYQVTLEVWDKTGNTASASTRFEMNNRLPSVAVTAEKKGQEVTLDMQSSGKVPLAFWRLEMWSTEGKLVKTAEGTELPVQIGMELPETEGNQDLVGTVVLQDILGNRVSREIKNLLQPPEPEEGKVIEEITVTKPWVEEF